MNQLSRVVLVTVCFFCCVVNVFADTVNLNSSNYRDLMQLKGVGQQKAEAIVAYRKHHGQFKSIAELKQVPGIGEHIVGMNQTQLIIK